MTINDLSEYHNIKTEIQQIKDNIEELELTIIGSSKITGMPITTSSNNSNPTEKKGIKLALLKQRLNDKLEKLLDEADKIENFIDTVDDSEVRIIIKKRFIDGKTWKEVSKDIISDRTTPYYKLKKYLEQRGDSNEKKIKSSSSK